MLTKNHPSQVLNASKVVPDPTFGFFMGMLTKTLREKIMDCTQAAYESIPEGDAGKLLMLDSKKEVEDFCQQRGWSVRDGQVRGCPLPSMFLAPSDGESSLVAVVCACVCSGNTSFPNRCSSTRRRARRSTSPHWKSSARTSPTPPSWSASSDVDHSGTGRGRGGS